MKYYIDLPKSLWELLTIPDDIQLLLGKKFNSWSDHEFNLFDISKFVSVDGIKWFADRNIILKKHIVLFRMSPNHSGPIHTDPDANFAINFIVSGHGEMQWLDVTGPADITYHTTEYGKLQKVKMWKRKKIIKSTVTEKWTGDTALVRTNVPHCVVTTDVPRLCISLRATSPQSFEEAAELLSSYAPVM